MYEESTLFRVAFLYWFYLYKECTPSTLEDSLFCVARLYWFYMSIYSCIEKVIALWARLHADFLQVWSLPASGSRLLKCMLWLGFHVVDNKPFQVVSLESNCTFRELNSLGIAVVKISEDRHLTCQERECEQLFASVGPRNYEHT